MKTVTCLLYTLVAFAALCHIGLTTPIVKRQVLDNPQSLDPAEQDLELHEEADRGKRKIEGAIELTYGAKNAILGLIFNKINGFIDQKTAWVNQLDQLNVAKNKQYNIESPKDPITSFGNVFGSVLSSKLNAASPLISLVISNLGSLSGGASGGEGGAGGGLGGLLGGILGGSGGGSSGGNGGNDVNGGDETKAEASAGVAAGFTLGR